MKTRKARRCTALLSLALILCLLLGTTALAAENPFHDVNSSDYFYEPVLWAVENGVTAGVTPTSFAPNAPCTRGQTVAFLWRAFGQAYAPENRKPLYGCCSQRLLLYSGPLGRRKRRDLWHLSNAVRPRGHRDPEPGCNVPLAGGRVSRCCYQHKPLYGCAGIGVLL